MRFVLGVLYAALILATSIFAGFISFALMLPDNPFTRFAGRTAAPPEAIALLAFALLAPLIPFVEQLGFPGGASIKFGEKKASEIRREVPLGVQRSAELLGAFDLPSVGAPEGIEK